jgi:excisionase family DNA binding protein
MRESLDLPNMPEYVTIKEAAKMLGVSDKRVYAYIEEGRLPAVRAAHVIMISVEDVRQFQPKISGRPRKNTPPWRTSPENNKLLVTSIAVQAKTSQQHKLRHKLEEIKSLGEHLFPGTIARYVVGSYTQPGLIEILLIWRISMMPDEKTHDHALEAFRKAFADVLDWSTAHYNEGEAFLHT